MHPATAPLRSITAATCSALLMGVFSSSAGAAEAPDPTRHILTADFRGVPGERRDDPITTGIYDESVALTALGAQGVVSRAFATQRVVADGMGGFSGSGLAELSALDRVTNGGRAQSGFGAAFTVFGSALVNFDVALEEEGDAEIGTVAVLRRFDDTGFENLALANDDLPSLQFSRLLGPGTYNFFIGAQVDPNQNLASAGLGRFSFNFSFGDAAGAPGSVPEPHSLALALAGLVGCAAAGRRHRRR